MSLYGIYPSTEYVINEIHKGIGGELLELSLCVPKTLEFSDKLSFYSKGLFKIGMALQGLDDLCDMKEDYKDGKVNLAIAKLIEDKKYSFRELQKVSFDEILEGDKDFVRIYLNIIGKKLFEGFNILQENGYPLGISDLKFLMRFLFKIRGLENFWKIIETDLSSNEKVNN